MVQALEILKGYITCEDPATRNKFYNLLDSFWHKNDGHILKSHTIDQAGNITFTFVKADGSTFNIALPALPNSKPISFITGLQEALNGLVAKVPGKGLSSNDFTLELLNKLNGLQNYQHPEFHQVAEIEGLSDALANLQPKAADGWGFSQENYSAGHKYKVERLDTNHYASPVNDLAALAAVPVAERTTKQRRYVHSEGVDYFFDATLVQGDVAPADQVDGTGFWMKSVAKPEIIDALTSTATDKPLSANQGNILKGFFDAINALLASDNVSLDELQEVVNYIQANRETLDTLGISNIAGLSSALEGKANLAGLNTFTGDQSLDAGLFKKITPGFSGKTGYLSMAATSDDNILFTNNVKTLYLLLSNLTAARSFSFPDKSGTLVVQEDLATLAPVSRPEKRITATTQYTAVKEDATKYLVFDNAIDFIINDGVFAKDDELEGDCEGGDVNIVPAAGVTLLKLDTQRLVILNKGPFGMRWKTATKASVFGALKPL